MQIIASFNTIDISVLNDENKVIAKYQADNVHYSLNTDTLLKEAANLIALGQAVANQALNPPKPAFTPGEQ